eukprot:COSAG02_NODE_2100_length_9827_cov_18.167352_2_plen_91_part_00
MRLIGTTVSFRGDRLRIFSTPAQLQRLVGGDENAPLDLEDLRKYVNYEGGYHGRHKVIKNLWQVIEELDPSDQVSHSAVIGRSRFSKPEF